MSKEPVERQQTTKEEMIKELSIPEERYDEYKDAFDYFDKDKSGDISVKELSSLFRSLGQTIAESEVKAMIDEIDDSGDGAISFDEFIYMMVKKIDKIEEAEPESENKEVTNNEDENANKKGGYEVPDDDEILKAFQVFDTDKSGTLNKIELRHILTKIGDKFSDEEVDDIFRQADLDGSGEIDYKEFIKYWRTTFMV
jgi:calmodulin